MNKFLVCAFYTKDTEYATIFEQTLKVSMEHWNVPYIVKETKNYGNWQRNVAEKPKVILEALNGVDKDTCIVSVDVDAKFIAYPRLFELIPNGFDIAYHTLNWNLWYGYTAPNPVMELLTGTMWFRNKDNVKQLCKEWYEQAIKTNTWEQKVLEKIVDKHLVKVYNLPLEYCYINSLPNNKKPLVACSPIITHYQASRKLKKEIK